MYITSYAESDLEQAAIEWFEELNYSKAYGPEISPEGEYPERLLYSDVILTDRLRDALTRINPGVPCEAIEEAIRIVEVPQSPSLLVNNRAFQRMITDGIDAEYRTPAGENRVAKVWLFATEPGRVEENDFLVVNQFTVIETSEKRPDIVIFVNGIPLVVMEAEERLERRSGDQ